MNNNSYYFHEQARYRHKRRVRQAKRKLRAKRNPPRVVAKPGTRPLSKMHPSHPLRYGVTVYDRRRYE